LHLAAKVPRGGQIEPTRLGEFEPNSETQALASSTIASGPIASLHPSPAPWLGIVANPFSGGGKSARHVQELQALLTARGIPVRVAETLDDRQRLVAESAAQPELCRALVIAGGDGTVSALINDSPCTPIAVLPTGTENLFARHFGFHCSPKVLAQAIVRGRSRLVDVGLANGRRFALMAGFGFDADVVTRHHRARLRSSGIPRPTNRAAYIEPILRSSLEYGFPEVTVEIEGLPSEQLVGTSVLVFNLPRYALGLPFAPGARDDDGLLDVVVFRKPGPWHAMRYLWLVFRGLHLSRKGVMHRRVSRASITSNGKVPVQLDGDPGGFLQPGPDGRWIVEVVPKALSVLSMP
jgi:diacylglycerol kinase family enzyme